MRIILITILGLGLLSLAGCGNETSTKQEKVVQTVEWYKAHPKERKEQLKICFDNPGELKNDPNCINAKAASNNLSGGSLKGREW